eukprot:142682_1
MHTILLIIKHYFIHSQSLILIHGRFQMLSLICHRRHIPLYCGYFLNHWMEDSRAQKQTCYWDDVYLKGTPLTVNPTINLSVYTVNPSVYTVNSSVSPSNNPSVYPTVNPTVSDIISTNIEWQKDDKTSDDTNRMQWIKIGSIIIAALLCVIFIGWVYRTRGKRIIQKSIENNANPQQEHRPTTNRGDMATSLGAFIAERAKNTTVDHVNQIEGRRRVKKQTKSKENETEKYTVEGPGPQVAVDLQQYTDEGDGMYGV